ncbi:DUF4099 domain-containing protein [Cytophagaceae bacterium DM2B3-1]|uniref:DUF4099 domain-containing protein n=1 Tax=Xanthocytophaga flava TaxID=3048013 RepID=A0ABT7CXB8_9BACT|nr:DUF4099 domain-containing protein [Xanthocytophaga flavus]MDJ1497587.1 DUF4099 domain-containing protein [Xanthocytophaga flavus]
MKFTEENIPYQDLAKLGITKESLGKNNNVEKLLKGERAILTTALSDYGIDRTLTIEIELKKNENGKVELMVKKAQDSLTQKSEFIFNEEHAFDSISIKEAKKVFDIKELPVTEIEKLGLTVESLKKSGDLRRLLDGEKTEPISMNIKVGNRSLDMKPVKLFLKEENGKITLGYQLQEGKRIETKTNFKAEKGLNAIGARKDIIKSQVSEKRQKL